MQISVIMVEFSGWGNVNGLLSILKPGLNTTRAESESESEHAYSYKNPLYSRHWKLGILLDRGADADPNICF